jgi:hypothetical protein
VGNASGRLGRRASGFVTDVTHTPTSTVHRHDRLRTSVTYTHGGEHRPSGETRFIPFHFLFRFTYNSCSKTATATTFSSSILSTCLFPLVTAHHCYHTGVDHHLPASIINNTCNSSLPRTRTCSSPHCDIKYVHKPTPTRMIFTTTDQVFCAYCWHKSLPSRMNLNIHCIR